MPADSKFEAALAETDPVVEELRRALERAQRQTAKAKAKTADLVDAVYRAARDAHLALGPQRPVKAPPKDRRRSHPLAALAHPTDWQCGKQTISFDMEILERRIGVYADKITQITELQRAASPVPVVHVMLGGDMVEGVAIFPGQAFEVQASLYTQLMKAAQIIEMFIRKMLAAFDTVYIWEEWGNHGRIGRRGDYPSSDNMDRILYAIVRQRFDGEKRIEWTPSTSWYQVVTVGNYRALLIHGDEIKSFGGNLPSFGIRRKVTSWAAGAIKEPFTDAYLGHFHLTDVIEMPNGHRAFLGGTPESDNEYAREFVAASGSPKQRLHFVDPIVGRVASEHVIYLDDDEKVA